MRRRTASFRRARDVGFALIIVLWTLVLIALIITGVVATGRIELHIAGNLTADAATEAAADGAVWRTIFALLDPDPKRRPPLDGAAHMVRIGDCQASVQVIDEAGRINPNLASPAVLEALLRVTGSAPEDAHRLATAIGEWTGASGEARTQAALIAEYRATGRDYAPLGAPLETIGELRRVLGMTPRVFAAIAPHLSLFAPAEPVAQAADPVVTAALDAVMPNGAAQLQETPPVPAENFTASIRVTVQGPDNARAKRTVIVRIVPGAGRYTILSWDDGADTP